MLNIKNIKILITLVVLPFMFSNIVLAKTSTSSVNVKQQNAIQDPNVLAEEYFNIGRSFFKLGQYKKAIKNFNIAIKYKPDYAEVYNNKGMTLNKLGKYQEAIKNYDLALKCQPNFAEAYNNKGNVLNTIGQYQEAIMLYDIAIKYNVSFAEAYK